MGETCVGEHCDGSKCERCGVRPRVPRERFCPGCKGIVLKEMKQSGYLTPVPKVSERTRKPRNSDDDESCRKRRGIKVGRSRNAASMLAGFTQGDLDDMLAVLDGRTGPDDREPAVYVDAEDVGEEGDGEWDGNEREVERAA